MDMLEVGPFHVFVLPGGEEKREEACESGPQHLSHLVDQNVVTCMHICTVKLRGLSPAKIFTAWEQGRMDLGGQVRILPRGRNGSFRR